MISVANKIGMEVYATGSSLRGFYPEALVFLAHFPYFGKVY
jgi:hypothetical protein